MKDILIFFGSGVAISALVMIALSLRDIAFEMKRKNYHDEQNKTKKG